MRGGARWDQELVQPAGGLFPPPGTRHAMAPVVRGAKKKTAPATGIAVTDASPPASLDEHTMQH